MDFFESVESFVPSMHPIVLSLGNFDGVHLGHRRVIKRTIEKARLLKGVSVILTFSNHPSQVLVNRRPALPICSPEHKIALFSQLPIDCLIQIPFTFEFSQQTPSQFLTAIKQYIPFQHLVLGYDARFGRNQSGDKETVKKLSVKMGFSTEYLEPVLFNDCVVSSSRIRTLLLKGKLQEVELLLGRKFSVMGKSEEKNQLGIQFGFPSVNMDVSQLCMPPFGVYTVNFLVAGRSIPGFANIGGNGPVLEAFLFEDPPPLNNQLAEVVLQEFIRPEIHFSSIEELETQISKDILEAKLKHHFKIGS